jgi:hypothetical protein
MNTILSSYSKYYTINNNNNNNNNNNAIFEVVLVNTPVFWGMICWIVLCRYERFEGTCFAQLQIFWDMELLILSPAHQFAQAGAHTHVQLIIS